jgi:hypothetical protein
MKSRFVFGLLAAMLVLALAPSSFAQVGITINNPASAGEVATNRAAETSDPVSQGAGITVSGSLIAESDLTVTNLTITFPARITSDNADIGDADVPDGDEIRILSATGVFGTATLIDRTNTSITIQLIDANIPSNTNSGSFRIVGVRINANSLADPPGPATASLSNSANNFFLNTTSFPVIADLGPGIGSVSQGAIADQEDEGSIQIFTNRQVTDAVASAVITEGFAFAWRSEEQNEIDSGPADGVVATQIRIVVNGIPDDVTLNWEALYSEDADLLVDPPSGTVDSDDEPDSNTITWTILDSDPTAVESLQINFTATPLMLPSVPSTGNITITATLAPNPDSDAAANDLAPGDLVPTYTEAEVGPTTIGSIVAANTTMLITYALRQGPFDTGIQISNTTADPFGAAGGGATPTAGNFIFDFFPRNPAGGAGTPFSLTTSSSTVFGGLSSDGTLAAGGTFVALLSEVLSRTSFTGDFSGYIFVRANFLNAHGNATISDFANYSLATQVLVLSPPATESRNQTDGVEALDH